MIELNTGYKTKKGVDVVLGDKLKGSSTHEVVVMIDKETGKFVVEAVEKRLKIMCFDLDDFLNTRVNVEITGNIIIRTPKETIF